MPSFDMEDSDTQEAIADEDTESELISATAETVKPNGAVVEVLTKEQEERIAEVELFLIKHDVKVNRKKKKLLANMLVGPYETYKLGVVVANCCKVRYTLPYMYATITGSRIMMKICCSGSMKWRSHPVLHNCLIFSFFFSTSLSFSATPIPSFFLTFTICPH